LACKAADPTHKLLSPESRKVELTDYDKICGESDTDPKEIEDAFANVAGNDGGYTHT